MFDEKVLERTGLAKAYNYSKKNPQYIGTQEQWEKADRLQGLLDEMSDDAIEQELMQKK